MREGSGKIGAKNQIDLLVNSGVLFHLELINRALSYTEKVS